MRAITKRLTGSMVSKMSLAAVVGAVCVATPTVASAQIDIGSALGGQLMESINKQLGDMIMKAMNRRVMVTPAIVNIDATAKTATLEFSNTTEDTLIAMISVGNTAPMGMSGAPNAEKQAGGLLADDEEPAKEEKAIEAKSSLASWVKGAPEKITLAPGEKKQVTVKLEVPAGTADGEYSAWILAATEAGVAKPAKEGEAKVEIKFESAPGSKERPKLTTGTKLVYRVVAAK